MKSIQHHPSTLQRLESPLLLCVGRLPLPCGFSGSTSIGSRPTNSSGTKITKRLLTASQEKVVPTLQLLCPTWHSFEAASFLLCWKLMKCRNKIKKHIKQPALLLIRDLARQRHGKNKTLTCSKDKPQLFNCGNVQCLTILQVNPVSLSLARVLFGSENCSTKEPWQPSVKWCATA